jgi:hypothetical protein
MYFLCKSKDSSSRSKREPIKEVCYMRFWSSKNNSLMLNNQNIKQISFVLYIHSYFFLTAKSNYKEDSCRMKIIIYLFYT